MTLDNQRIMRIGAVCIQSVMHYLHCSLVTVHFCIMPSVTNVQPMDALLYSAIVSSKRAHTFGQGWANVYDVIITDLCVVTLTAV